ncbi:MAG TPA: thiol peroxidase [Candidatus Ozemobacteraceae bacterium]|nr:thiol peroxidase [Candidatus Ozemobacteraceae bacterium]
MAQESLKECGKVTFQGNPLTLLGNSVKVGDTAPDFTLLTTELKPLSLKETKGVRILTTVPSLDTPVCDMQVRRFNQEAAKLPNVSIYAISADLPFAQKRWCGGAGVDKLTTLSDHLSMGFAAAYGLYVKELRLVARAVMVIDSTGKVVYRELVPEITQQPDYDGALKAAKEAK